MTKGEQALAKARELQANGTVGRYTGRRGARSNPAQVIKTVRGHDSALQREIASMTAKGYVVDNISARKALLSATAGVFTRKQVWTVTFKRVVAS